MHIIFSHGKESGPEGSKIQQLRALALSAGHSAESVDYLDLADVADRVYRLRQRIVAVEGDVILVGSSMGGYVSWASTCELLADASLQDCSVLGLFLLVPAVYMSGYPLLKEPMNSPTMTVIHGWKDDIVPYQNSLRLAEKYQADYHLLHDGVMVTA